MNRKGLNINMDFKQWLSEMAIGQADLIGKGWEKELPPGKKQDHTTIDALLHEMSIANFNLKGKWGEKDKKYGYDKKDIGILTNTKGVEKIKRAWANTKNEYDFYFLRSPEGLKHIEVGEVDVDWVKKNLRLDVEPRENAITVIFTNNRGQEKIPMYAWMIAHRLGHAVKNVKLFQEKFTQEIIRDFNEVLSSVYGIDRPNRGYGQFQYLDSKELLAFAKSVGTMKSARSESVANFGEFVYELMAQYIIKGKIEFNKIPKSYIIKKHFAWGNPNHTLARANVGKDEEDGSNWEIDEWSGLLDAHADKYDYYLQTIFDGLEGKIFVM